MSDEKASPKWLQLPKDVLVLIREAAIVLFLVLLFLWPSGIRTKLDDLRITSIAGVQLAPLQDANTSAKNAGARLAEVEQNLQETEDVLRRLVPRIPDPGARREIEAVLARIRTSQEDSRAANASLKRSLIGQQNLIQELAPGQIEATGWIYLGQMDASKHAWMEGSPKTVQPTPPALRQGQKLYVRDDVYLRAEAPCGARTKAPVIGVVKEGREVEVLQVDHCVASPGNLSVWAKIRRS